MRIVTISDTHLMTIARDIPDGDVLIHAGDHTMMGTADEIVAAFRWLNSMPHKDALTVAGNHDFFLDPSIPDGHHFRSWVIRRPFTVDYLLQSFPSVTYLQDSGVEIDGVKFFGSPWTPYFHGWAFNFPEYDALAGSVAKETWSKIPGDTNVLITHGPPAGILDRVESANGDTRAGDPHLRERIEKLRALRLHVFGHLHESNGVERIKRWREEVTFVNAAMCDRERYAPVQPIHVVDI
jgi:3',5'-cyclic AMP phosphodiesterase CpdA